VTSIPPCSACDLRAQFHPLHIHYKITTTWQHKQKPRLAPSRLHCARTDTSQNNSFILSGPKKIVYEDRPVPELKDPHDVLLQVNFTGICGSDIHYWQHGRIGDYVVKDPMVLGHESSG